MIASTLTFIGGITPIVFQGGTPIFIDCERSSWNMDPELLAEELESCKRRGKLPKAVVPTDLYGSCADLDRILEICALYGIPVVTDSAEALDAKRQLKARSSKGKTWKCMLEEELRQPCFLSMEIRLLRLQVVGCWHLTIRH